MFRAAFTSAFAVAPQAVQQKMLTAFCGEKEQLTRLTWWERVEPPAAPEVSWDRKGSRDWLGIVAEVSG